MSQTILLTGGAGYIGSHTYVALVEAGYRVIIYDNFSNAREDVPDRLALLTGKPVPCHRADIRDATALRAAFAADQIDAVIHFAALKAVGESMAHPLAYADTNISGLITLLQTMEEAGVWRLVFSSSATVYGTPEALPIPETAPTGHTNPYGFTKLACEEILQQLAASDARWCFGILRYFNPAGAHASALIGEDPRDTPNNLMPYLARVATGELPALQVFGNDYDTPDGTGVRDYIHVEDLAQGHVLSLTSLLASGQGHLVNLGTGQGHSVLEVLHAYSRACGRALAYEEAPRRPGDVAACYADPARAESVLGFKARRSLEDMCNSSWAWINSHRE